MNVLQTIRSPKGEEMVILSRKEYDKLTRLAYDEDAHDAALAQTQLKKLKAGKSSLIPAKVAFAIAADGVHPVRAWREHLGWTAAELAKKTKLARTTISQMETGKRKGTLAAHQAIARAYGISVAALVE